MIYHWAPLLFFEYYIIKPIFFIAMIDLLISTFAMMGLTFLIGFFVAAVIKLILLIFIVLTVWNCCGYIAGDNTGRK